ncbi:MAG: efflux RND transporter periplasmic adaptor subunit [Deltaproteobacteria bacterium]|nr:efflux RND transporter periplasmic adaptor subunit [Deltaproteobacteria bacterium]
MISAGFGRRAWLLFGLSLAGLGCEGEAPAKTGPNGPPPARVAVAEVRSGSIEAQWSFLGDVNALQHARLASGASGEVRRVLVRVGDKVERGDLLVEVDPSLETSGIGRARTCQA